jgi:protein gp37
VTKTKIEWTDEVWNPVTGCTKVSPGCDNCYAERLTERFHGPGSFAEVKLHEDKLDAPLRWRRPRMVFVNSMSDLFHDSIPNGFIAAVFAVMAGSPSHTFQVLTKRHGRMRSLFASEVFHDLMVGAARKMYYEMKLPLPGDMSWVWPLPNVWLGVSVEDQKRADLRIPALLATPAAVRFLSCEPLLGPVDLSRYVSGDCPECGQDITTEACGTVHADMACDPTATGLQWVIAGGESGPGARPMHPGWAQTLRDQCQAAGVPYFFKQWGEWAPVPTDHPKAQGMDVRGYFGAQCNYVERPPMSALPAGQWSIGGDTGFTPMGRVGKTRAGRLLDGRTWDEFPAEVNSER